MSAEVVVRMRDGTAYYAGVATCGSVWACPVCGPKIRHRRVERIEAALAAALDRGMGVLFLTVTVRHHRGQGLGWLRVESERAWKALQQSRTWRRFRDATGARLIVAREVTWGPENGWHPHRHCAVVVDRPLSAEEVVAWSDQLAAEWVHQTGRLGLDADLAHGWDLQLCERGEQLGRYLVKLRDGSGLGLEMVRGDLKRARGERFTPEAILAAAVDTGDLEMVRLWREYEQATKGWRMVTWSVGLEADLLGEVDERSDEDLAAEDVGGDEVAALSPRTWGVVVELGLEVELLEAAEAGVLGDRLRSWFGPKGWRLSP